MVLSLVRSGCSSAHQACKFSRGLPERLRHRHVDQRAQVLAQRQARLAADHLGPEHDGQLFPGVDPEGSRGSATPEIFAKRAGHTRPRVAGGLASRKSVKCLEVHATHPTARRHRRRGLRLGLLGHHRLGGAEAASCRANRFASILSSSSPKPAAFGHDRTLAAACPRAGRPRSRLKMKTRRPASSALRTGAKGAIDGSRARRRFCPLTDLAGATGNGEVG
jgi:hypothetical protein